MIELLKKNNNLQFTEKTPVDSELSNTSTNPVQNKVITNKINEIEQAIPTTSINNYVKLAETVLEEKAGVIEWSNTLTGKPMSNYKDFFIFWVGAYTEAATNQGFICRGNDGNIYFSYHFKNKATSTRAGWFLIEEVIRDTENNLVIWKTTFPKADLSNISQGYYHQGLTDCNRDVMSDICSSAATTFVNRIRFGNVSNGVSFAAGTQAILYGRER